MMAVVAQVDVAKARQLPAGNHSQGSSNSGDRTGGHTGMNSSSSTALHTDQLLQQQQQQQQGLLMFAGEFKEEEVGVRQLAALLCHAGLEQHWPEATGLPGPPPPSAPLP